MYFFRVGPFRYALDVTVRSAQEAVEQLYADYPHYEAGEWMDFHLRLFPDSAWKLGRAKARLFLDHVEPFGTFPIEQAGAMLEWGMNWCIWLNLSHWLIFHAAMLERNGGGLILAADSGVGKSTLAAGLMFSGWRLLSDELTLLDPDDTISGQDCPLARLVPIPRPVCLKNQSIDVIRRFAPQAELSREYPDTGKGRIAHVKPLANAVQRMDERVTPRWILFPHYRPGAPTSWSRWEKAETVIQLGRNGVDYSTLGSKGFEAICNLVHHCECWRFEYSDMREAVAVLAEMADGQTEHPLSEKEEVIK